MKITFGTILWFLPIICVVVAEHAPINYEKVLIKHLKARYEHIGKEGRPVAKASDTMQVYVGLTLMQILELDSESQTMEITAFVIMTWTDINLKWNPADFDGVKKAHLNYNDIFIPDITGYNTASEMEFMVEDPNVVVMNNGTVIFVPSIKQKFACAVPPKSAGEKFTCTMKFGSWAYDGDMIDLTATATEVDLSYFTPNPRWELVSSGVERHEGHYDCCPEPYIDVAFSLNLQHKSGHKKSEKHEL